MRTNSKIIGTTAALACCTVASFTVAQTDTNSLASVSPRTSNETPELEKSAEAPNQNWNFHAQNTDIIQDALSFPAKYTGQHSLNNLNELRETITLDLTAGVRLWRGAELHADGLLWQGFGLSHTFGVVDFPNGDAYKAGTPTPNLMFSHLFIRQTIGFGGEQEDVPDGPLTLAGKQDVSRFTITLGRMTPLDIFDQNTYAEDPHSQFMNWATMANITWDYGQDTIGYGSGVALELNQPRWALRYLFIPMPPYHNFQNVGSGNSGDDQYLTWPSRGSYGPFLKSWSMATEFEQRFSIKSHPGAIRLLAWANEASMVTYAAATAILIADGPNANLAPAQAYHYAYGFGLNLEQEVSQSVGVFSRIGWNDGKTQALEFSDANWSGSVGVSVKGIRWKRPDDTFGLAGVVSGISRDNQRFLQAGGLGIEDGDGALSYGTEKILETYYNFKIWKTIHLTADYQFVSDPAFNRDRGPVSILAGRIHWEF